jgi:hypothetical protein
MTAPVNVLAELDRRIEIGEMFGQEHDLPNLPGNAALREARAAVAELMEAAESAMGAIRAIAPAGVTYKPRDRLQAALARCGGAA